MRKQRPASQAFSERLQSILSLRGLSHAELAEHLGVSSRTVSRWCGRDGEPSLGQLRSIADYLGVTSDALITPTEVVVTIKLPAARAPLYCLHCGGDLEGGCQCSG